jgi:hypothetical protein
MGTVLSDATDELLQLSCIESLLQEVLGRKQEVD